MLSANFLSFFLACIEDKYPISMMFVLELMFIIFKGFEMISIPAMPFQSSYLLGGLMCLVVTVRSPVLNSH